MREYNRISASHEQRETRSGIVWEIAAATLAVFLNNVIKRMKDLNSSKTALEEEWQSLCRASSHSLKQIMLSSDKSNACESMPATPSSHFAEHAINDEHVTDSWALLIEGCFRLEKLAWLPSSIQSDTLAFFSFERWCAFWHEVQSRTFIIYRESSLLPVARDLMNSTHKSESDSITTSEHRWATSDLMWKYMSTDTQDIAKRPRREQSRLPVDVASAQVLHRLQQERRCMCLVQAANDGRLASAIGHTKLAVLLTEPLRHSCVPSHLLALESSDQLRPRVALQSTGREAARTETDSAAISICWESNCDCNIAYTEREALLQKRFGAEYVCDCDLCALDRWRQTTAASKVIASRVDYSTLPATLIEDLKPIAYAYMRAEKFKHASALLKQQIQRKASDGDAWYALGAALLSSRGTSWLSAHSVWAQGENICPGHEMLAEVMSKVRSYSAAVIQTSSTCTLPSVTEHMFDDVFNIGMTTAPALSSADCAQAIQAAEAFAALNTGWTTSRHYAVPTTDIPVHASPQLLHWFANTLLPQALPLLRHMFFQGLPMQCAIHDAFVVKYSASDGQRYLPMHTDESTHSLTVVLNDLSEFEGGGTFFDVLGGAIRPPIGHILAFDGNLLHGGDVLLSGTRYIVAVFLLLAPVEASPADEWHNLARTDAAAGSETMSKGASENVDTAGNFSFAFSF